MMPPNHSDIGKDSLDYRAALRIPISWPDPELYPVPDHWLYKKCSVKTVKKAVLRSRNYLFSAPVPTLTIISAPAPASAIYWLFKLF